MIAKLNRASAARVACARSAGAPRAAPWRALPAGRLGRARAGAKRHSTSPGDTPHPLPRAPRATMGSGQGGWTAEQLREAALQLQIERKKKDKALLLDIRGA